MEPPGTSTPEGDNSTPARHHISLRLITSLATHLVDVSVGSTETADEDWGSASPLLSTLTACTLTLEEDVAGADLGNGHLLDLELAGLLSAKAAVVTAYLLVDERLHRAGRNSTLDHCLLLACDELL